MIFLLAAFVIVLESGFNLLSVLFGVLGCALVANALASGRGPSSLPRVEIDQTGIRLRALLHDEQISWPTIASVEPYIRLSADGDDYSINILYERQKGANPADRKCGRLWLNLFVLGPDRDSGAANKIAAWLYELKAVAATGGNVLDGAQPPKYLRCLVIH